MPNLLVGNNITAPLIRLGAPTGFSECVQVMRDGAQVGRLDNNASGVRLQAISGTLQLRGTANTGLDITTTANLGMTLDVAGDVSLTRTATTTSLRIISDAGQVSQVVFRSGVNARWGFGKSNNTESGSNAGSHFDIDRFNDAGTYLSTPLHIDRQTGTVDFADGATGATPGTTDDSTRFATTAWVRDRAVAFWHQEIHPRENATRTTGTMDTPMGITVPFACNLTRVYVRFTTADASGDTTIQILKNGSATGMPLLTVTAPATTQTANVSVALAQNDVLTANVTAVGTTPGSSLAVVYTGQPA